MIRFAIYSTIGLILLAAFPLTAQSTCSEQHQATVDSHHSMSTTEQQSLTDYGIALHPTVLEPGVRTFHIELDLDSTDTHLDSIRFTHCSPFILLDDLELNGAPFTSIVLKDDGRGRDAVANDFTFTSELITYTGAFPFDASVKKFELCDGTGFEPDGTEIPRLRKAIFGLRLSPESLSSEQPEYLSPRLYALDHVVNFVRTNTKQSGSRDSELYSTVFQHLEDRYDFVTILHAHGLGGYSRNGSLFEVSNSVVGVSSSPRIIDFTGDYGGASQLKAVATLLPYVEADGETFLHELNHIYGGENATELGLGWNHYDDVLFVREGSGFGNSQFPVRDITQLDANRYEVDINYTSRITFSNLELYQMGMLPLDSIIFPIEVLQNPQMESSTVYTADTLTLVERDSMLYYHGPRIPAYGDAPTTWRMLFVVLSDYPLPAKELVWFEEISKAAMSTASDEQFARHTFYQSTRGHGQLDTRVRFPTSTTQAQVDQAPSSLQVVPNPTGGLFDIKGPHSSTSKWQIRDAIGRTCLEGKGHKVDATALKNGMYVLTVFNPSFVESAVFMKH